MRGTTFYVPGRVRGLSHANRYRRHVVSLATYRRARPYETQTWLLIRCCIFYLPSSMMRLWLGMPIPPKRVLSQRQYTEQIPTESSSLKCNWHRTTHHIPMRIERSALTNTKRIPLFIGSNVRRRDSMYPSSKQTMGSVQIPTEKYYRNCN